MTTEKNEEAKSPPETISRESLYLKAKKEEISKTALDLLFDDDGWQALSPTEKGEGGGTRMYVHFLGVAELLVEAKEKWLAVEIPKPAK